MIREYFSCVKYVNNVDYVRIIVSDLGSYQGWYIKDDAALLVLLISMQ